MQEVSMKLDTYINNYLNLWDFYGVIQVIKKDEILFERAYGYSSIEFGIKNEIKSCFSIASMSKQFTAFAIMLLYDKKMLDIDKPANLFLPIDLKIDDSITVHHLLSHTSGLYNFYNFENDFFAEYNRMNYSRIDFFNLYINKKPINPSGKEFDYNISNYNLLAWIIEYVSGENYEDFIRNNIFIPLNMANSYVDDGCKTIKNRSCNYVKDFDANIKSPYHNEKFSIGAGSIISNSDDLFKWYSCLRDRKILSQKTYTRFFNKNQDNYCYGLEHHHVYGTDRYSHGGDHLGVTTFMQNYFDEDICIIILSNNEAIDQYRLGNAISDILHHVDVTHPNIHEEYSLSEEQLKEYCGTYLQNKIEIELIKGNLYFTRLRGNLHIEIYPIGKGRFVRRYSDQIAPYRIARNENGDMTFFGYIKK
ncbi:serine hydrolase [Ornithinibacillus sp. L9]|uniref:Serine hydrolase n=1 Tax=Ornithinibacillus caprae TaxID=2678566 RepID=A0A6N8FF66_9BACI|nr:serine hydrolase domain-containing protein [Ornithinibacillus caprae]MUK87831.1 serine hydrolase [Ornithinibacillus caprae]